MNINKFTIKVVLSIMLIFTLIIPSAFADINIDANLNNEMANIQGVSTYFNIPVSVKVLHNDKIEYINTINTDGNGIFNFSFPVEDDEKYDGKVKIQDESKTFEIKEDDHTGGHKPDEDNITVDVRIEGYKGTIFDDSITFDPEDYKDSDGKYRITDPDGEEHYATHPNVLLATIVALNEENIRDNSIGNQDNYVGRMAGEEEFDFKEHSTCGWLVRVNEFLINKGVGVWSIDNGDKIEWFFSDLDADSYFGYIDVNSKRLKLGDTLTVKVTGSKSGHKNELNYNSEKIKIEGATVYFGDETYITDENGEVEITMNKSGRYKLYAKKLDLESECNGYYFPSLTKTEEVSISVRGNSSNSKKQENLNNDIKKANDLIEKANTQKKITEAVEKLDDLLDDNTDNEYKSKILESLDKGIDTAKEILDKTDDPSKIADMAVDILKATSSIQGKLDGEDKKQLGEKSDQFIKNTAEKLSNHEVSENQVKKQGTKFAAEISNNDIKKALDNLNDRDKLIKALKDNGIKGSDKIEKKLTLEVPSNGAKQVETKLPSDTLQKAKEAGADKVLVKTELASFDVPTDAVKDVKEGEEINLSAKKLDSNDVPAAKEAGVPEGTPIYDLDFKVGDKKVSKFDEKLGITIPYKGEAKAGETVIVYYLKDDGTVEEMETEYDEVSKTVTFKTDHFSKYYMNAEKIITFTDIENHWAKEEITFLAGKGIINGKTAITFVPEANISRAEFSALIIRMLGKEASENDSIPFTDVTKEKWYHKFVKSAYNFGLINGKSNTVFDPEGNITRQEMAKIISQVLINEGYSKASTIELKLFNDKDKVANWAKESVALTVKEGIINGIKENQGKKFAPTNNATRAQAAKMLYELYKLIVD